MSEAQKSLESLQKERGRLRQSHEVLEAALQLEARDASFVPLYIAVAKYMEAAMKRLDSQDITMTSLLANKLNSAATEQQEILSEVHRRLAGNRKHLEKLIACRAVLEGSPDNATAIRSFEKTSSAYIDYIHTNMGHHAPSTTLARELLVGPDWLQIADLDADYFALEDRLFNRLMDSRPAKLL